MQHHLRYALCQQSRNLNETRAYDLILKGGTVVNHDGAGNPRSCHSRTAALPGSAASAMSPPPRPSIARACISCPASSTARCISASPARTQGRPGNRRPRRGHGRRHQRFRNAQYQAARPSPPRRLPTRCAAPADRMYCDFAFYMGGTRENVEPNSPRFEKLPGCAGIKVFMGSSTGELLVEDDEGVARILAQTNRRAAFHSEDEFRLRQRMRRTDRRRSRQPSRLARCRSRTALHRTALPHCARRTGKRIHVLHVSTADEMPLARRQQGCRHRRGNAASPDPVRPMTTHGSAPCCR